MKHQYISFSLKQILNNKKNFTAHSSDWIVENCPPSPIGQSCQEIGQVKSVYTK